MNSNKELSVLLIGEFPPPHAGIGVQTKLLHDTLVLNGVKTGILSLSPKNTGLSAPLNEIRYLRGVVNLVRFIFNLRKIKQYKIIHLLSSSGLNFYIFTIPVLFLSKVFNKKCIVHYHGGGAKVFFERKKHLINLLKKLADLVVVPSGFLEKVFSDLDLSTIIIPNIISLTEFKFKKREKIRPHVLSVRNLTPVYNIPCAVKAFKILHEKYPNAKLTIAGDGPSKKEIKKIIVELNLTSAITFTGNIPNKTINSLYQASDMLINASNIDNMPISILEAQATGLVVITTNPGGIPFMIKDGNNGLLADINNHKQLGRNLISAISNQEKSKEMIVEGLENVQSMGTEKIYSLWINIYNNI